MRKKEEIKQKLFEIGFTIKKNEPPKDINNYLDDEVDFIIKYSEKQNKTFAEFILINEYKPRSTQDWCRYENGDIKIYTTTELLEIFKKEQDGL